MRLQISISTVCAVSPFGRLSSQILPMMLNSTEVLVMVAVEVQLYDWSLYDTSTLTSHTVKVPGDPFSFTVDELP